jgi:hypothetical protein
VLPLQCGCFGAKRKTSNSFGVRGVQTQRTEDHGSVKVIAFLALFSYAFRPAEARCGWRRASGGAAARRASGAGRRSSGVASLRYALRLAFELTAMWTGA